MDTPDQPTEKPEPPPTTTFTTELAIGLGGLLAFVLIISVLATVIFMKKRATARRPSRPSGQALELERMNEAADNDYYEGGRSIATDNDYYQGGKMLEQS